MSPHGYYSPKTRRTNWPKTIGNGLVALLGTPAATAGVLADLALIGQGAYELMYNVSPDGSIFNDMNSLELGLTAVWGVASVYILPYSIKKGKEFLEGVRYLRHKKEKRKREEVDRLLNGYYNQD